MPDNTFIDNSNKNKRGVSVFYNFYCRSFLQVLYYVCSMSYGHKRARNKRIGPRGGTERLHHFLNIADIWGRNRIDERVKEIALSRRDATVIGAKSTIANDNRAPVAMAA